MVMCVGALLLRGQLGICTKPYAKMDSIPVNYNVPSAKKGKVYGGIIFRCLTEGEIAGKRLILPY
jgi:hypothetical protein